MQIDKLTAAGYITVEKGFKGKMPRTTCKITPAGEEAYIFPQENNYLLKKK